GKTWPEKLVSGADFYMQPVWSPKGDALAWVEWDHPNMPWDGTRLMFAILSGDKPGLVESHQIDGGEEVAAFQPEFSPDGRYLSYITNNGEWDQLVVMDLFTAEKMILVEDKVLLKPAWVQGVRVQAWAPDSRSIIFIENIQGSTLLKKVTLETKEIISVNLQPYTNVSQISISPVGRIALLVQSSTIPPRLITLTDGKIEIIARSQSESIRPEDLPEPQLIDWKASDGMQVFGIYYPPTNSRFTAKGLPPVVVYIHGGPTSQVMTGYNLDTAFFTSRGYGYLAVNYRGSTGYGRSYMLALRQRWGEVDTMDAAEGAKALIGMGLADPDKLIIKGGSAGGYTVLNALIHYPGLFKAGLCSYGVSNLFTLEMDTHKFEAHYNASLVGELPEAASRFHAWSPVFHADSIKDPIAVFQGADDKVVPQEQSETIVAALRANGVPHEYHLYEGEGHGFRKTETLISHYKDIDRFLKQYVIFSV
ncbi:MAG: S9 family peptidase, partial [Anaerolineaceae bacterium]|nr:S9 family peptidase [Anaerolineaceae bacterium]